MLLFNLCRFSLADCLGSDMSQEALNTCRALIDALRYARYVILLHIIWYTMQLLATERSYLFLVVIMMQLSFR